MTNTTLPIAITIDPDNFGPAMLALSNDRQRLFVIAYVLHGLPQQDAYAAAGYEATASRQENSSRLLHTPKIQDAILELGQGLMRSSGPKAIRALEKILDEPKAANRDKIAAAKELLDRSGFVASTNHNINVNHTTRTREELEEYIRSMAKKFGHDPKALLGEDDANILEAEYSEVPEASPDQEPPIPEALRDLF